MSKKVSLKQLKQLRNIINDCLPNYLEQRAYITAFGKDIETNKDVSVMRSFNEYAQRSQANWSYWLVMGTIRKQGE
jgi:hypothetical protein